MGLLAYFFHFSSSDIENMDDKKLVFWAKRAYEIIKILEKRRK